MKLRNKTKVADDCGGSQCVRLELACPDAQEVCVAGSFNDWHPNVTPMVRLQDGKWAKELSLLPGRYEYRFVVDGVWMDDPAAAELIPNSFGTANAVLEVRPVASARSSATARTQVRQSERHNYEAEDTHGTPVGGGRADRGAESLRAAAAPAFRQRRD